MSLQARVKKRERWRLCRDVYVYSRKCQKSSTYMQSNHYSGSISLIPYIKVVFIFLGQILKLLRSSVHKILRLRLWNIRTLLISAGRSQYLRITLEMR